MNIIGSKSGSTVVTISTDQPSPRESFTWRLRPEPVVDISKKLSLIFNRLKDLEIVDEKILNNWSSRLQCREFNLAGRNKRTERASELCSLLFEVIHPLVVVSPENSEIESKLLGVDCEVREVLLCILPDDIKADAFLQQQQDLYEEEQFEQEKAAAALHLKQEEMWLNSHYAALIKHYSQPRVKLNVLLEQIKNSRLFLSEMNEWEARFDQLDFETHELEKKINNGFVICLLLCELIHPSLLTSHDKKEIENLIAFEQNLKEILVSVLPKSVDLDHFIKFVENSLDEVFFVKEKENILEAFKEKQKELISFYLNPRLKIEGVFELIRNSNLFENQLDKLNTWELKLRRLDFESTERAKQEKHALLICLFLHDMTRPAFMSEQTFQNKQKILSFEDKIKEALILILPEDVEVEKFMLKFQDSYDAQLREKFYLILSSFQKKTQNLIDSANDLNQDIKQQLKLLKLRLREVLNMRRLMSEELFNKLDALNSRVASLLEKMKQNMEDVEKIGEQLQKEQFEFLQLLQLCEKVLQKV